MIARFADWFNSRRWFIRWLMFAEYLLIASFVLGVRGPEMIARAKQFS
jgi:hypothetical protein